MPVNVWDAASAALVAAAGAPAIATTSAGVAWSAAEEAFSTGTYSTLADGLEFTTLNALLHH